MYIISIDPGISGAICFFENGSVVDVIDMPSMADGKKNKKQGNGSQIYNEINLKIKNIDKKEKEASRTKAIEIFPQISSKLSKKKDNNKADAILIASFFNNTHLSN